MKESGGHPDSAQALYILGLIMQPGLPPERKPTFGRVIAGVINVNIIRLCLRGWYGERYLPVVEYLYPLGSATGAPH